MRALRAVPRLLPDLPRARPRGRLAARAHLPGAAGFGLRLYQRSGLQTLLRGAGATKLMPQRLQEMEAMLGPTQGGVLRWVAPEVTPAQGTPRFRVGFIEGCIMPQ